MPSANKTPNYKLNQWAGNEYPKRQDFVDDNAIIDAELKKQADNLKAHSDDTVAHMTQAQKDTLASAVQNATIGGTAVPKNDQQLQFPAYPTIPGSLKNPNALTVSQGYGGQTGSYDGSSPMGISIPVVTLHTASPSSTMADGELYGVY